MNFIHQLFVLVFSPPVTCEVHMNPRTLSRSLQNINMLLKAVFTNDKLCACALNVFRKNRNKDKNAGFLTMTICRAVMIEY